MTNLAFSLTEYYDRSLPSRILGWGGVLLLVLLVLYVPLPFASVQPSGVFLIEVSAAVAFLFWVLRLTFCGSPEEVVRFREMHRLRESALKKAPFFHRHSLLGAILNRITFDKYPRKNVGPELILETVPLHFSRLEYFSVLGYPVRNTGIELIAGTFLLLLCAQLIPLPGPILAILSPSASDLYRSAAKLTDSQNSFHPLTVNSFVTFSKLCEYLAYFAIFLVAVNTLLARSFYRILAYAILFSGFLQAGYGLYEFMLGGAKILNYVKKLNIGVATGTFINSNHYATYLGMCLPFLFGVVLRRMEALKPYGKELSTRIFQTFEKEGVQVLILLFLVVLLCVALMSSHSRGGVLFSFLTIIAFFIAYFRKRRVLVLKGYWILVIACVAVLSLWIGVDPLLSRMERLPTEFSKEAGRLAVWKDTLRMCLDFPVAGTGGGTFRAIFPMYRSFPHNRVYSYAHNDYLQFISEMGVLTILLFGAFFFLLIRRARTVMKRELDSVRMVQFGAFFSLVSLALNSLTDFSLHIPAVAVTAVIVLALFFGRCSTRSGMPADPAYMQAE